MTGRFQGTQFDLDNLDLEYGQEIELKVKVRVVETTYRETASGEPRRILVLRPLNVTNLVDVGSPPAAEIVVESPLGTPASKFEPVLVPADNPSPERSAEPEPVSVAAHLLERVSRPTVAGRTRDPILAAFLEQ